MNEKAIKKIEKGISDLQEQLKKLKEPKLENGKWYRDRSFGNYLVCFDESRSSYGFTRSNNWNELLTIPTHDDHRLTPATNSEVEAALIAEAKKRGFKEGVTYRTLTGSKFS